MTSPRSDEPERVGICNVCGGGIWEGDDYITVAFSYHRGCAERLHADLGAAL